MHKYNNSPCGCNKPKPCGCEQPKLCGCQTKLELLCTYYSGQPLEPLNIQPGMDGNLVIKIINDYIKNILENLEVPETVIQSVGDGSVVYKGLSDEFVHEIKSLKKEDGILITEQDDTITLGIDAEWIAENIDIAIENIGTGVDVYKGKLNGSHRFRKLRSSDNTINISIDGNDSIDFKADYPVIDGISTPAIGSGTEIYKGLSGKKIQLARLKSQTLMIKGEDDGSISIETPGSGGSTSNNWYIDPSFIRPSNWNTPQNPKQSIDGIPVPEGSLNDPFITWDEYLLKVIGGNGVHDGTTNFSGFYIPSGKPYSKIFPKHVKKLVFLSSVTTNKDCEVNLQTYEFLNSSALYYNGNNDYAIDMRRIWNGMPQSGGVIEFNIYLGLVNATITNLTKPGVLYHKTVKSQTSSLVKSMLEVHSRSAISNIYETSSKTFSQLTNSDGSPMIHGSYPVMGTTEAPNTPVVVIDGQNNNYWGASFDGEFPIAITSSTETNIEIRNNGSLYCGTEFRPFAAQNTTSYEKRLVTGLGGMSSEEQELVAFFGGVYYKPYRNRNIISIKDNSSFRMNRTSNPTDAKTGIGVNSYFRLDGGALTIDDSMRTPIATHSTSIFDCTTANNSVYIGGGFYDSQAYYFLKGDGSTIPNFVISNFNVKHVEKIQENTGNILVNTAGTWSTIKQMSFNTQIYEHANNNDAKIAGLIPGAVFFNTTTNALDRVI